LQAAEALPPLEAELDLLTDAVRAAGEVALGYFGNSPNVWAKVGDSPVSDADIAVDRMLAGRLLALRPSYGWLSEETEDAGTRLTAPRTFIVDPIDGTRDFIAGGRAWTIPLAIVEAGEPVAAVIYAPAKEEMYQAVRGRGATLNGAPIRVSDRTSLHGARIAGPRRLFRPPLIPDDVHVSVRFHASLAYRLALVAAGRLDGAAVKGAAHDWDLAAADLIVREAGGTIAGLDGSVLRYDRKEISHPPIVAATPGLVDEIGALMRAALAAAEAGGLA
jgi:myo-inositol-1(or 4)-monophosphatase